MFGDFDTYDVIIGGTVIGFSGTDAQADEDVSTVIYDGGSEVFTSKAYETTIHGFYTPIYYKSNITFTGQQPLHINVLEYIG